MVATVLRPYILACLAVTCGTLFSGCDFDAVELAIKRKAKEVVKDALKPKTDQPQQTASTDGSPVLKSADSLTVASFNIQVFGQSKLENRRATEILAQIVRRFDVVAIQELRSKQQDVIPRFLSLVNSDGSKYDYVIGPRLGRTSSKEQYVFVYDTNRLEVVPQSVYTVNDPQDLLHREPLVATFQAVGVANPFRFTLVNIHTDPDEVDYEVDALADVFVQVQQDRIREDDVILLGDLNADPYHLGRLGKLPSLVAVISGVPTNTRGTKTYDNLIFDSRSTVEFQGQSGVLRMADEFGLTLEEALEVSDHEPVWAAFSITEGVSHGRQAGNEPVEMFR
ncbi:endonuclease/exonuclease/phosphatase family protein [Thalassoroseus pseudoceratinae]|uniref:endonuclease/exonuclease/phosphatase family protein n=1 Tax=Thalassoroseus pseudoceratinae TaxID=2713176 RepID=UPI001420261B|nr:endonuclease/exonuclease/phosphatase family protein [Thalassoroseus pseudoceratinae]